MLRLFAPIPGVGLLTAATVLAETNGFELIRNKRQLTSYAGFDVKRKTIGDFGKRESPEYQKKETNIYEKPCICLLLQPYDHDERFKAIFARLVSKHGIKMKAAVAVQRKLLEMIYTIYKTNIPYDKDYFKKLESSIAAP